MRETHRLQLTSLSPLRPLSRYNEVTEWVLRMGCHDGMAISRNARVPESYATREEALEAYRRIRKSYRNMGWQVWFAKIESPSGAIEELESNATQDSFFGA